MADSLDEAVGAGAAEEEVDEALSRLHPLHPVIERARVAVEAGVATAGYALPGPVLAGEFPTGSTNPQSLLTSHGYLVLLNSGLVRLLGRLANITVAATGVGSEPAFLDPTATSDLVVDALWDYLCEPARFSRRRRVLDEDELSRPRGGDRPSATKSFRRS